MNISKESPIQTKGLKRNVIDKFYTSPNAVAFCLSIITENLTILPEKDLIIEPSAGNGSFIPGIRSLCQHSIFYDIEPEHDDIIEKDYLTLEPNKHISHIHTNKHIHVIGNPPFGRQSSLAIKFIKHSATFATTISFILPKSFKKNSLKKHFPSLFHLIVEKELPSNSFLVNHTPHNVPCVFQIWEKRDYNRKKTIKLAPIHFKFVKQYEQPDISFRRVGVYAGKIDTKINNKSPQSHYFIQFIDTPLRPELYTLLGSITFHSCTDTVGPKSISKQELIKEFNQILT